MALSYAGKARYHWGREKRGGIIMASSEGGLHGHMGGLVWFMEIGSVLFVLAVFVFYFLLKRSIKKKKSAISSEIKEKRPPGE
jgi:phosphotransferase system  glucose/maltose/N-acetylglucosamine-specific IIC component